VKPFVELLASVRQLFSCTPVKVLKFVSSIKASGRSCIFISHNMFHIYPVADRIIILDRGEIVDTFVKGQISLEKLEAKLLEIAGTSEIDLKVPIGSKAVAQK
jgi:ABC-type sugar transport system ATPase subunit